MLAVPPCRLLVARHVAGLRRILDSPFDTKDGKISRPISNLHHPDHEAERAARFPGRRRTRRRAGGGPPPGAGAAGDFPQHRGTGRNWARRCSSATPRACSSRRSDRPSCAAPPPSTMRSSAPATRRANCAAPSTAASRWACPPPRTWSCSPTCCLRSARAFPTSTWKSSTASIRWSRRAAGRFHGFLRRPGARARAGRAAGREAVRQYPRHPGPQGHPLAQAKSLRELADAHWITTSITHKAEEELGPLFEKHGLPAPKLAMRAQSALTFLTALPSSDLLMMLPVQWLRYPLLRDTFQEIKVRRSCPRRPFASCSAPDCR